MPTVRNQTRSVCTECGTRFRGGPLEAMFRETGYGGARWVWIAKLLCHACRQGQLDYWHTSSLVKRAD